MNIKGINFPEFNIRNRLDINKVVKYFDHNKKELTPYVDIWLRENMHNNYDLINYYRSEIVGKIPNYAYIEKSNFLIYKKEKNEVSAIRNKINDICTQLSYCLGRNNSIKIENRTIKVNLNEQVWKQMNSLKGVIKFDWKDSFDKFYSETEGFGDEKGRFDILFRNGKLEKRYVQSNSDIITKVKTIGSKRRINVSVVINFSKLECIRNDNGSSFDYLNEKEWILDWKCVHFQHGFFMVYPPEDGSIKFTPKAVRYPSVIKSYNYLRDYLNERLEPVRCKVFKMELEICDQLKLDKAIAKFATMSNQRAIRTTPAKDTNPVPMQMSFNQALSKAQEMTEEDFHKYKSKYIDFLVKQQCILYKVIPCVERLSYRNTDTSEYSFLFSIKCKSNNILIVHENVNPDRSSLLFVVGKDNYNNAIHEIYDFLQSAEINKRSSLRSKNIEVSSHLVKGYKSINHEDLNTWKLSIFKLKRVY